MMESEEDEVEVAADIRTSVVVPSDMDRTFPVSDTYKKIYINYLEVQRYKISSIADGFSLLHRTHVLALGHSS